LDTKKDYYGILGVSKDATLDEIKQAYRQIARETHPDINGGDECKTVCFKDATDAFSVLSKKDRREEYDMLTTVPKQSKSVEEILRENASIAQDLRRDTGRKSGRNVGDPFCSSCTSDTTAKEKTCNDKKSDMGVTSLFGKLKTAYRIMKDVLSEEEKSAHKIEYVNLGGLEYTVRDSQDVHLETRIPIDITDALYGRKVVVQVIGRTREGYYVKGRVKMNVTPGVDLARPIRMKGVGIAGGDMYVNLYIEPPENLTFEEKELYQKLRDIKQYKK